ncbi:hypothetical protein GCM10007276_07530 [Agaricicola taiwanensis]|uniref:Uncharacterized protein n=1 Tax=Agaricicola taiwanensis TaxID=591372 RepID=A0A8J2YFK1_9RHOB|nr:hypothetical protein [Agaricicola taiwanensis]GGE32740.1 hypothetical protein GCM10007276_07530 [Agaricicola taiwanensis]
MTRTLIAAAAAVCFTLPAFAQTAGGSTSAALCTSEATQIQAAVERSSLQQEQKSQVNSALGAAIDQEKAGNSQACQATLDQVKLALGIQPATPSGRSSTTSPPPAAQ